MSETITLELIKQDLQRHARPWYDTDIRFLLSRCSELEAAQTDRILGIPTDVNTVAWAERAMEAREVVRLLSDQFNGVDNGHCTICGGFRLYDTASRVQPCENKTCLSHRITALNLEAVDQKALDRIFNKARAVLEQQTDNLQGE